jgi:hypothetical protein
MTEDNVRHVIEPFKEGQKIYEAYTYVTLSIVPIFIKTIRQDLMVLDKDMKEEKNIHLS